MTGVGEVDGGGRTLLVVNQEEGRQDGRSRFDVWRETTKTLGSCFDPHLFQNDVKIDLPVWLLTHSLTHYLLVSTSTGPGP